MRRSPWSLPLLLLTAVATALVAACGAGARLTSTSPDAVASALEAAQTAPLVLSFTGSLSLDTHGLTNVPAGLQPALAKLGHGGAVSGSLTQESSSRRQVTMSAGGHTYALVQYDGHGYVGRDGGGLAELPKPLPSSSTTLSPATIGAAVGALDFRNVGTDQGAEHYRAALTTASLEKLVQALAGGTSATQAEQIATMLAPFVTLRPGASADLWVSQAGGLVRASVSGSFSIDVGRIAAAFAGFASPGALGKSLPGGTLSGSLSFAATVTPHSGPVSVSKPVATATLPATSGGGGAMSGGAGGIPWAA